MNDEKVMCAMVLEFESIKLELAGDGTLWLIRPDGEGMSIDKTHFERHLCEYYRKNF